MGKKIFLFIFTFFVIFLKDLKAEKYPLKNIKKIMICPFISGNSYCDAFQISMETAKQIQLLSGIDIVLPTEVERLIKELKNKYDNIDPVSIGRIANCDAVLVGEVLSYNPYNEPSITLRIKVISTCTLKDFITIERLSRTGIAPSYTPRNSILWKGIITIDTMSKEIIRQIKYYAEKKKLEQHSYGWYIYLYDKEKFYEVIGWIIARKIKSLQEKLEDTLEKFSPQHRLIWRRR